MEPIIILFLISILIIIYIYNKDTKKSLSIIKRARNDLQGRSHQEEKAMDSLYYELMKNPEKNISIRDWDKEQELRTKADIHKTRLKKYGKSKINNEMLFLGPKGGIYKLTSEGNKKYI